MRITIFIILILSFTLIINADIYKWQDSEGIWHFSNIKEKAPENNVYIINTIINRENIKGSSEPSKRFELPSKSKPSINELWGYWENKILPYKNELIIAKEELNLAIKHKQYLINSARIIPLYSNFRFFKSRDWRDRNMMTPLRRIFGYRYINKEEISKAILDVKKKELAYTEAKIRWQNLGNQLRDTDIPYRLWMDYFWNDSLIENLESN